MRWRQDRETGKLVPIDESAAKHDGLIICDHFEAFKSPVDGSVITSKKELEAHNKRNNVVNSAEFSPEYLAKKRQEREDFFSGKKSRQEVLERKQEMYEKIIRAEQGLPT